MDTVLITGASRGIGRALANTFAEYGYDLVLNCSKSEAELDELIKELNSMYDVKIYKLVADVGNAEEFKAAFEILEPKVRDSVVMLINNAGISHVGLLQDMSIDEWNKVISTNLTGVFNASQLVIPNFIKNHEGKILNISSVWGEVGASMEVAYSASKGGVNAFTKALAKELAPSGISVNAISCGYIDTAMNGHLSDAEKDMLFNEIPAGRPGEPEEVAELALSIAKSSNYLNGQIIRMDGAWI